MNLTLLKDIGQIFAWTAAGIFFAYRFYTGWFHPDLSLSLACERKPFPPGTASTSIDFLTVLATVKKGPNMSIRLVDLQARVTFDGKSLEKRFEGIERRSFKLQNARGSFAVQEVDWEGTPVIGPHYLSLAPGDETQFAALFEVPSDTICTIKVLLFARKFIPGRSQQSNSNLNPHQWGAALISLPGGTAKNAV